MPTRNPNVKTKLLPDGHVVLFTEEHNWAHTLSPLAGIAWEFCDGEHSVDQIMERVSETAQVSLTDVMKSDLVAMLEELTGAGLLNVSK